MLFTFSAKHQERKTHWRIICVRQWTWDARARSKSCAPSRPSRAHQRWIFLRLRRRDLPVVPFLSQFLSRHRTETNRNRNRSDHLEVIHRRFGNKFEILLERNFYLIDLYRCWKEFYLLVNNFKPKLVEAKSSTSHASPIILVEKQHREEKTGNNPQQRFSSCSREGVPWCPPKLC